MKSALELALEKSEGLVDKDRARLGPEQIAAIDETRKTYEARWAEQEIVLRQRIEKAGAGEDPQAAAEQRQQLQEEMKSVREGLFAERDEKIEAIRRGE
ncbi:MAG: hypothetical protein OXG13_09350 [Gemmatimonadaceae bacterium]|nr:hypothetical protein [Gemmatimonadaceae bacterium]